MIVLFLIIQLSLSVFNLIWYGRLFFVAPSKGAFFLTLVPLFFILTAVFQLLKACGIDIIPIIVTEWSAAILGVGILISMLQSFCAIEDIKSNK